MDTSEQNDQEHNENDEEEAKEDGKERARGKPAQEASAAARFGAETIAIGVANALGAVVSVLGRAATSGLWWPLW